MVNRQHQMPGAEPLWWRDTYRGGLKMKFIRIAMALAAAGITALLRFLPIPQ